MYMKLSKSIFYLVCFLMSAFIFRNDACELYIPEKAGAEYDLTHYDNKERPTVLAKYKVLSNSQVGSRTVVRVQYETLSFDKPEQGSTKGEFEAYCEGDKFHFNLSSYSMPNNMQQMKDMELKMQGDMVYLPAKPQVGQDLSGGTATFEMVAKNSPKMPINLNVKTTMTYLSRKVDSFEKITTPAGSFDCFKIVSDVEVKIAFAKFQAKTSEWVAKGVGLIKSETIDKKGKRVGYSLLTRLKK